MNQDSSASFSVPHTQNTAPVFEFRCLYTHDLKRKQKRWRDGRLKFHAFNKRVMVYDERSNFVGDTHWKASQFDEGEELELERGGVLVEVGEYIGKRDQDLTELVDKRVQKREEREAAKIANGSPARSHASLGRPQVSTPAGSQLRPKPLNSVIGTPSGHYGRAVIPNLSPFEQKHGKHDENTGERPTKRQRYNEPPSKSGYAQNLLGSTLDLNSSRPPSTASIRYEPFKVTIHRSQSNTIDLTEDDAGAEKRPNRKSPPRVDKRKPARSPPSRRGYASSLTGASLNLTRPSVDTTKAVAKSASTCRRSHDRSPPQEERPPSSPQEDSVMSIDSVKHILKAKSKPAETTPVHSSCLNPTGTATRDPSESRNRNRKHRKTTSVLTDSSLPCQKSREITISGPPSANSKIFQLISDQPVATLRIKTRPPRRMMMLMESRSTASHSPIRAEPTPLETGSSSPIDSGIDHRTTDNLLTRRRVSNVEPRPADSAKPSLKSSPDRSPVEPRPIENLVPQMKTPLVLPERPSQGSEKPSYKTSSRPPSLEEVAAPEERETQNIHCHQESVVSLKASSMESHSLKILDAATPNHEACGPGAKRLMDIPKSFNSNDLPTSERVLDVKNGQTHPTSKSPNPDVAATDLVLEKPKVGTPSATSRLEALSMPEIPKVVPPISRTRLLNPATRGQSIPAAAHKTLDKLAPIINEGQIISPPTIIGRPRTLLTRDNAEIRGVAKGFGSDESGGPWSRESFDLFGAWKPPGRNLEVRCTTGSY